MSFVCNYQKLNRFVQKGIVCVDDDKNRKKLILTFTLENLPVHYMILSNRRIRLKDIIKKLKISYERVHRIVYVGLDTKKLSAE